MSKLTIALAGSALALCLISAYAQNTPAETQPADTQDATQGAVPAGAEAQERTTQGNEPGDGERHGSSEGGSDRETPGDLPTAAPATEGSSGAAGER